MNLKRDWLGENGFTLVELLVALVISAVLFIAAGTWFGNMTKNIFKMGWDSDQQRAVQTILDLFSEDVRMGGMAVYGGGGGSGTDITIQNKDGSSNLFAYNLVGANIRRTIFTTASTVDLLSQYAQNSGITVTNLNFETVPDGAPGVDTKQKVQMTVITRIKSDTNTNKTHVVEAALRNATPTDWSSP